jgi:hypothetical protein
MQSDLWTLH